MVGGGRLKEKGWEGRGDPKNQTIPFPLFLSPGLSPPRPRSGEGCVLMGEGDVKATDFLTLLAALACMPSTTAPESQG